MNQIVYFVRHGQTDWNAEMRFQGQRDIPINALGEQQAARNGAMLKSLLPEPEAFDYVASPLARTRRTMEIIRTGLSMPVDGYRTDDRLLELNYGDFEGLTLDEMPRLYGEMSAARNRNKWEFVPPGDKAESYAMQARRFAPWLEAVREPTICVTHGGILRCIWHIAGGLAPDEAGTLTIHQDKILCLKDGQLEWL